MTNIDRDPKRVALEQIQHIREACEVLTREINGNELSKALGSSGYVRACSLTIDAALSRMGAKR